MRLTNTTAKQSTLHFAWTGMVSILKNSWLRSTGRSKTRSTRKLGLLWCRERTPLSMKEGTGVIVYNLYNQAMRNSLSFAAFMSRNMDLLAKWCPSHLHPARRLRKWVRGCPRKGGGLGGGAASLLIIWTMASWTKTQTPLWPRFREQGHARIGASFDCILSRWETKLTSLSLFWKTKMKWSKHQWGLTRRGRMEATVTIEALKSLRKKIKLAFKI